MVFGARRVERIEALDQELQSGGRKAIAIQTDVTQSAQVQRLVDAAVAASEVTCYVCGAPGEMRKPGWATVRCDAHAKQEVE